MKSAFVKVSELFLLICLCFVIVSKDGYCETSVQVIGRGSTKEEATHDALRNAVERAMGVFIYSTTEVENYRLTKDKIVAASKGYVRDYRIVKEETHDGLYFLTVSVLVDVEMLKSRIHKETKAVTYDEVLKDYAIVKQQQGTLQNFAKILQNIASTPLNEMYIIDFAGYEIKEVKLNSTLVNVAFRITPNPFYWEKYYSILRLIDNKDSAISVCADFSLLKKNSDYYYKGSVYHIPPELAKLTLNERRGEFIIDLGGARYAGGTKRFFDRIRGEKYKIDPKATNCELGPLSEEGIKNFRFIPEDGDTIIWPLRLDNPALIKSLPKIKLSLNELK